MGIAEQYELAKSDIVTAFSALLDAAELAFEDEPSIEHAIYAWKDSTAEFADCLINARNRLRLCDRRPGLGSGACRRTCGGNSLTNVLKVIRSRPASPAFH